MKAALVFGVTFASAALFFACANSDETALEGHDAGVSTEDAGVIDAASYGDSAVEDSGALDAGGDAAEKVCVEPADAGCESLNPGACGAGLLHCVDAGLTPVCEPIATTQACYSGAGGTRGVGVCHDGTQSCVGSLGACDGEVDPAPVENCFNTLDDDCSGAVNNGCPDHVFLGTPHALAGAGGPGGGAGSISCPLGAFVTRVDSWGDNADSEASGVTIYCATPTLIQEASGYTILLTPNAPAPYGSLTGTNDPMSNLLRSNDCGISGLTAITYTVGVADTYVEGLGNHCGTSAVTLNADNTLSFNFVTNGDTTYTYYLSSSAPFFEEACASNEVIVGFSLHTGLWLDNIAPICAPLLTAYK